MKKSTLALSVAAAIGSFGLVGTAFAIGTLEVGQVYTTTTSTLAAATEATSLVLNPDGIGHQLIVPYYTVQDSAQTLLNIANTDTRNAKIVKVRFRGAANSDDVFDFQLLLSPGDIWAGSLTQDATTGVAKLTAYDNSCTVPSTVRKNQTLDSNGQVVDATGSLFVTSRVDPTPANGSAANETREGYIEIINMADIAPNAFNSVASAADKASTLYGTVKHAAGVAACSDTVLTAALKTNYATVAEANTASFNGFPNANAPAAATQFAYSLTAPSGGLTADWVILNQTKVAAWSGSATALEARVGDVRAVGKLTFWPQLPGSAATAAQLAGRSYTADPLFATRIVPVQHFDLPDLSTPYVATDVAPGAAHKRVDALAAELAVNSVTNQYVTKTISGVTDFLFSQPTRRYSVGVNYKATAASVYVTSGTVAAPVLRNGTNFADTADGKNTRIAVPSAAEPLNNLSGFGNAEGNYWRLIDPILGTPTDTSTLAVVNRQVCLTSVGNPSIIDREESKPAAGGFVISPNVPGVTIPLCGEVAILSVNGGGTVDGSALGASVVRNDITLATGFDVGSATFATRGLPVLSSTFMRVANGTTFYGFTIPSKVTR